MCSFRDGVGALDLEEAPPHPAEQLFGLGDMFVGMPPAPGLPDYPFFPPRRHRAVGK